MATFQSNLHLCQTCTSLFGGSATACGGGYHVVNQGEAASSREGFFNVAHHRSHLSFQESVENRCRICVELFAEIEESHFSPEWTATLDWTKDLQIHLDWTEDFMINVEVCSNDHFLRYSKASDGVSEGDVDSWSHFEFQIFSQVSPILPGGIALANIRYELRTFRNIDKLYESKEEELVAGLQSFGSRDTNAQSPCVDSIGSMATAIHDYSQLQSSSTGVDASLNQIAMWLGQCLQNHRDCKLHHLPEKVRPSRLLEVGKPGEPLIRLRTVNPIEPVEELPYTTLSHCWGSTKSFQLRSGTTQQLHNGINVLSLPKTFRDAVYVTRRLGIGHLWIDSLCILQDSKQDWMNESAKMGAIYEGSTLTLSATVSKNSEGGFFFVRDTLIVQPLHIVAEWPQYLAKHVDGVVSSHVAKLRRLVFTRSDVWQTDVDNTALGKRSWVMQERILSQRVVQFGRNQLFWECRNLKACEMLPAGLNIPRHPFFGGHIMKPIDTLAIYHLPSGAPADTLVLDVDPQAWSKAVAKAHRAWVQLIEDYSDCQMTMPKDILIACSGVAKAFERRLDETYIAGLLKSQLPFHLCWWTCSHGTKPSDTGSFNGDRIRIPGPQKAGSETSSIDWRAPSWSWASMDSKVVWPRRYFSRYRSGNFDFEDYLQLLHLVNYEIVSVADDTTGQVSDGWLEVQAQTFQMDWISLQNTRDDDFLTSFLVLDYDSYWCAYADIRFDEHSQFERHYSTCTPVTAMPAVVFLQSENNVYTSIYGVLLDAAGANSQGTKGRTRLGQFKLSTHAKSYEEVFELFRRWGATEVKRIVLI